MLSLKSPFFKFHAHRNMICNKFFYQLVNILIQRPWWAVDKPWLSALWINDWMQKSFFLYHRLSSYIAIPLICSKFSTISDLDCSFSLMIQSWAGREIFSFSYMRREAYLTSLSGIVWCTLANVGAVMWEYVQSVST